MTPATPRPYEPAEREALFDLYERVWGTRPEAADFEWWYEHSPAGPALRTLAERDGRVVGAAAMSFVRARVGGREELVAMTLAVATDVDERGRGIFRMLEHANEENVAARGCGIVLTFPNAMSRPGFARLGFDEIWRGRIWVRPPLPALRLGRFRVEELAAIPDDASRLAASGRPSNGPVPDAAFLEWRYLRSPRPYRIWGAYEGESLRGLLAVRLRRGRLAVVCHAFGEVAQLLRAAGANGAPATIALVPRELRRAFVAAGFVPTLKIARVFGKVLQPQGSLAGRWQFQLGDFDVF